VRNRRSHQILTETPDSATHAFLFDVDGTLIDIASTPQAVQVPASLRLNLQTLAERTSGATALVSGRSLADLDRLFGAIQLTMVGGHGAELRLWHGGRAQQQRAEALPDWIRQRCTAITGLDDGILLEDKGYSIAIHYRLVPDQERPIRDAMAAILADGAGGIFEVQHGKAVVEIKRAGVNKGSGIRALMAQTPFSGRRPIFIGDDITDEDAFAVMPEFDGVAFSVAGAERRFETAADVRQWIARIASFAG
jgi:trehalose 6-phosphate phosphatase